MGILQKKRRTTGKKALAHRGKGGQDRGTAFLALRLGVVRNILSTAGNSMTGSEKPSPEPLLKKETSPAVLGGRMLETLWSLQMPIIVGLGGSQP